MTGPQPGPGRRPKFDVAYICRRKARAEPRPKFDVLSPSGCDQCAPKWLATESDAPHGIVCAVDAMSGAL